MTTITSNYFSTVGYIQRLRQADFTEAQAEAVATIIEQQSQAIQKQQIELESLKNKDLVTNGDVELAKMELKKDIETVRVEIKGLEIKLMLLYAGGWLLLLGVLAKGFHWV